jgi:hypothetical protein
VHTHSHTHAIADARIFVAWEPVTGTCPQLAASDCSSDAPRPSTPPARAPPMALPLNTRSRHLTCTSSGLDDTIYDELRSPSCHGRSHQSLSGLQSSQPPARKAVGFIVLDPFLWAEGSPSGYHTSIIRLSASANSGTAAFLMQAVLKVLAQEEAQHGRRMVLSLGLSPLCIPQANVHSQHCTRNALVSSHSCPEHDQGGQSRLRRDVQSTGRSLNHYKTAGALLVSVAVAKRRAAVPLPGTDMPLTMAELGALTQKHHKYIRMSAPHPSTCRAWLRSKPATVEACATCCQPGATWTLQHCKS